MKPLWKGQLNQGDLLYMPRGVVHFGKVQTLNPKKMNPDDKQFSLHVTLSNKQNQSWLDFINIPNTLETRQNLPGLFSMNYHDYKDKLD